MIRRGERLRWNGSGRCSGEVTAGCERWWRLTWRGCASERKKAKQAWTLARDTGDDESIMISVDLDRDEGLGGEGRGGSRLGSPCCVRGDASEAEDGSGED